MRLSFPTNLEDGRNDDRDDGARAFPYRHGLVWPASQYSMSLSHQYSYLPDLHYGMSLNNSFTAIFFILLGPGSRFNPSFTLSVVLSLPCMNYFTAECGYCVLQRPPYLPPYDFPLFDLINGCVAWFQAQKCKRYWNHCEWMSRKRWRAFFNGYLTFKSFPFAATKWWFNELMQDVPLLQFLSTLRVKSKNNTKTEFSNLELRR